MLLQGLLLLVCVAGISALARGRGGEPALFGIATILAFAGGMVVSRVFGRESVMQLVLPWSLVGVVALFARFFLGAGRPKPDSMWSCPHCHMVNESSYVQCQACERPWEPS